MLQLISIQTDAVEDAMLTMLMYEPKEDPFSFTDLSWLENPWWPSLLIQVAGLTVSEEAALAYVPDSSYMLHIMYMESRKS